MLASRAGVVPVSTRPWWREVRNILRTEIRGHRGSTAEPSPKINSRTRRPNVVEDEAETPSYVLLNSGGHANASRLGQTFEMSRDVLRRHRRCRRPQQRCRPGERRYGTRCDCQ